MKLPPPANGEAQGAQGLEDHRQADASASTRRRRSPARRSSAWTCSSPGLRTAVVAAPAGVRRQAQVKFDAAEALKVARRREGGADRRPASPSSPSTSGPRSSAATRSTVEWDAARGRRRRQRRRCSPSSARLAQTPGAKVAERRRRRRRARRRRRRARGRVRGAVPRARADGAAQLHGEDRRRSLRDLDRHAVPDRAIRGARRRSSARSPSKVTIHTTFLGGGFGRRANPDVRLRRRGGARREGGRRRRSRSCGRARTTCAAATTARRTSTASQVGARRGRHAGGVASRRSSASRSSPARRSRRSMVKNGIDATSVEGVADSPYLDGDARPRASTLHSPKTRGHRCCGGARSATRTPRSRWRA